LDLTRLADPSWLGLACQTQGPRPVGANPSFFGLANMSNPRLTIVGLVYLSDPTKVGLSTLPHPRLVGAGLIFLGLANLPNPRWFDLSNMSNPRYLSLAT